MIKRTKDSSVSWVLTSIIVISRTAKINNAQRLNGRSRRWTRFSFSLMIFTIGVAIKITANTINDFIARKAMITEQANTARHLNKVNLERIICLSTEYSNGVTRRIRAIG